MYLSNVAQKFDAQLNFKMPRALLDGLNEIKKAHGLEPAEVLRRLGDAAVAFYQENGFFSFPVRLEPEEGFIMRAIRYQSATNLSAATANAEKADETTQAKTPGKRVS